MVPVTLRKQQNRIEETKFKSLEIQLANLQERFNVVINWINSQFYDLIGLPETVVLAIRGSPDRGHTSVGIIKRKNNISGSLKSSKPVRNQQSKVKNVKEDSTCNRLKKLGVKTVNEAEEQQYPTIPMVKLEKLVLKDIHLLTDKYGITNLPAIKTALLNINCERNSGLICCTVCNKQFKLRIQLEKHKLICHPKNLTIANNESSQSKRRDCNLTADIDEESLHERVISLTPISDEERDSESEYDPLEDVHSNDSCAEDILGNINEKNIQNSPDLSVEPESIVKEEINIKEEGIEVDAYISQVAKTAESLQLEEEKSVTHLFYLRKSSENIWTQNDTNEKAGIGNKINLLEFEKLVTSQTEPRSLTCVVCNKSFSTIRKVTRHEMEVHLTNEDRKKYQIRRSSKQIKQKLKTYSFSCDICGRPFGDSGLLSRHKNTHVSSEVITELDGNGLPQYRCIHCNSVFPEKQKCIFHVVRKCAIEKRQEPESTQTHKKRKYVRHKKTEKRECRNPKKDIPCEICGLTVNSYKLKRHMQTHTGEKNFVCKECGRRFSRLGTLSRHELAIHKKEKTHKCQYCEKSFVLKFVKDAHEKKHLGISTVSCHICGFTFTCLQNLKKHITGVHENQRPYKCVLCDKSFKSSTSLHYHVKTHNNPNGRKRGLNKEVDHLKAAAKRRHCRVLKDIRVPLLTNLMDSIATPAKEIETKPIDADISGV